MGTDIHSVIQVQADGAWRTVAQRPGKDDRNYDTFAVYADVRNGVGFAGISTGEGWTPIAQPRGLPPDFEVWRESHHGTWMGDHSYSWLTLAEIEAAWAALDGKEYRANGGAVPARERVWLLEKQMQAMQQEARDHRVTSDQVRLVFGFDS